MRVLFATQPLRSHLHSLLPVAYAARERGHTVAIASGSSLAPVARHLGFELLPCGSGDIADIDSHLPPELRERLVGEPTVVRHLMAFSAGLAPGFARDLLDRGAAWRPDVIVREPVEFGSVIAAERLGLPYASVMWAAYVDPRFIIRDAVAGVAAAFGLDGEAVIAGFDRHLVIRYLPPSWRIPDTSWPDTASSFRATPYDRAADDDVVWTDRLATSGSRPVVYATIGLTFSTDPTVFRAVLDAFDGMDVDAIVTTGHALDAAALGSVPANVQVSDYIPGSLVLPRCAAIVMHGGFNTLHQALWHGLPSVVVPQMGGDQGMSAEHVARLGLGLHVPGPVPSPDDLRRAIERVVAEPGFAERARAMREEMVSLPPLEDAVSRLESLAGAIPIG